MTMPGSFEGVVDLLAPELRRRGVYPESEGRGLRLGRGCLGKERKGWGRIILGQDSSTMCILRKPEVRTERPRRVSFKFI